MIEINGFTLLDVGIALIVLWSLYKGFRAGLIESLVGMLGWIITLYVGTHFARSLGYLFANIVHDPILQTALAFLVIVLLMLSIMWGLSLVLKSLVDALALTPLEKLAGGVFGAARGVLVVLVIMSLIGSWASSTTWWQQSVLAPALLPYAPLALQMGKELASSAWQELTPHHEASNGAGSEFADHASSSDAVALEKHHAHTHDSSVNSQ